MLEKQQKEKERERIEREREKLEREERERREEKERQDSACKLVSRHFEESLRLASQKVRVLFSYKVISWKRFFLTIVLKLI